MMLMMGFVMLLPLLLIGAVVYALIMRPQSNQTGPPQSSQTSADILNARYVRGELSKSEYEEMRRDLEG